MVANGTPSTDKGRDFIPQTEVATDNEQSQTADRYFERVVLRQQQQGKTAKSTDWGGDCSIQADFAGITNTMTAARVTAREEAAIGKYRQ